MGRGISEALRPVGAPPMAQIRTDFPSAPVRIETERLILRILRVDDFPEYAAVAADPETFRYSQRAGMTNDESWTRLLRHAGHWALLGCGLFGVEEKASGRFVGEAGLGDFHRGLGPEFDDAPEAAWTIARWAQGRGYATEAAAAAHRWMELRFATTRSVCIIHVDNAASLSVARKLGYRAFAERRYRGYRALLLERLTAPAG
jgi:RimJ/RimL family protein N-acetyltransferase